MLERGAVQKRMGCHGRQASVAVTAPLYHDQHLPDQPGSTTGASTQQIPAGPHPSFTSIAGPQQGSHPVLGWRSGAAFISFTCRILLPVLP